MQTAAMLSQQDFARVSMTDDRCVAMPGVAAALGRSVEGETGVAGVNNLTEFCVAVGAPEGLLAAVAGEGSNEDSLPAFTSSHRVFDNRAPLLAPVTP